jgi:hypothetical protein
MICLISISAVSECKAGSGTEVWSFSASAGR